MSNAMKCVCAWCGKVLREGAEPTTHGICAGCKAKNFDEKEGAK